MKLDFEYGLGTMQAELPDNTDVFKKWKDLLRNEKSEK